MFFELNSKQELEIDYKAASLVPAFSAIISDSSLGKMAFRFLIMAYDYRSPYRHIPEERRISKVVEDLYRKKSKVEALDCEKMRTAIDTYNELQFDSDTSEYYTINEKCVQTAEFIHDLELSSENLDSLERAGKMLTTYNKLKTELRELLFSRAEKGDDERTKGGKKKSYMEEYWLKNGKKNTAAKPGVFPADREWNSEA